MPKPAIDTSPAGARDRSASPSPVLAAIAGSASRRGARRAAWRCTSASTPYSSRTALCVRTSSVGPAVEDTSVLQQHERIAADAGGEVQVVRRQHDRERHAGRRRSRSSAAISSWYARSSAAVGSSRSSSGGGRRPLREICASAAAMITRCFSPPLSVAKGRVSKRSRAGGLERAPRQLVDPAAPRSRTRRGADSGPSARLRARSSRTRGASPAAPPPCAARARSRRDPPQVAARRA